MRHLVAPFSVLGAVALAAGCSSSPSSSAPSDGGADAANTVVAHFHMEETVAGGQEVFKCQFVTLPNVQAFMIKGQHTYTPGSHHLLFYTTDLTSIPSGQSAVQDCYEGGGATNNVMSHVRGVLYAGQVPTGSETLPQGVGLSTSPSQVLLFQVHYLNAGAASLDAKVDVDLTLDTGNDIVYKAGILFFYDPFIDVPAGATAKASMRCPIPGDVTLLYAQSHYHSRGTSYGAYIDPATGPLATKPFYTSDSWSSPPNQEMTMPIKSGSRLRFECGYDNTSGTATYFQGQSAQTNEMCMFIGMYYPEITEITDYCLKGQDMYGNGTATCGASLSCLQACGKVGVGIFGGGVSECEQTCMVDSCPSASADLMPIISCIHGTCSSACADTSTAGCTQCLQTSCGTQMSACQASACQ